MRTWETLDGRFVSEQPEEWVYGYDSVGNKIINESIIHIKQENYRYEALHVICKELWTYVGSYYCKGKVISSREAYHINKIAKLNNSTMYGNYNNYKKERSW